MTPRDCPTCGRSFWKPTKFCSEECRAAGRKKRQADPAKQITFNCATCGTEVTRWRGYGATISGNQFCSNKCAVRHTKTVRHYVARESDMVLDSTWEMLFAGLCGWHKIPVVRTDRSMAIATKGGHAYAPDFIVDERIAVEVKGYNSGAQERGWTAWATRVGPLTVVDKAMMDRLKGAQSRTEFMEALESGVSAQDSPEGP